MGDTPMSPGPDLSGHLFFIQVVIPAEAGIHDKGEHRGSPLRRA
jgi:hypothetical protein